MALESRRQQSALSLPEIEEALREITDSHNLGIHLGVPPENLERFERDFPRDTIRQRTETITYWLRNCANATWERLAAAVERLGRHGNLVRRLRELAQQSNQNGADSVDELDFQTPPDSPVESDAEDIFERISSFSSLTVESPVDGIDEHMLALATKQLQLEFSTLLTKVRCSLEKLQVTSRSVLSHLRTIEAVGPMFEAVYISRSQKFHGTVSRSIESLEELFPAIAPFCSWFNHLLVENIIETFCDDDDKLLQKWERFKERFAKYCKARLYKCPLDQFGEDHPHGYTIPVVMKVDYEWRSVRVSQLRVVMDAITQILNVKPYNVYLRAVQNGCVELLIRLPLHVAINRLPPTAEQITALQHKAVTQIRCSKISSSFVIAHRLAQMGENIDKTIESDPSIMVALHNEIMEQTSPSFSLVDIGQYLSEGALEAYQQMVKASNVANRQVYNIGGHLRKQGDELLARYNNLVQQQSYKFSLYGIVTLPAIYSLFLYNYVPHPVSKALLFTSLAATGVGYMYVYSIV